MTNERIPNAPGIGGPPDSWYESDEPEPAPAGPVCEMPGCGQPRLANQCGCIRHAICERCEVDVDVCGVLVLAPSGEAVCVACTTLRAVAS